MRLEKIEFNKNCPEISKMKAIKGNIGKEVLLEDFHEGALVGKIDSSEDFHYLFLRKYETKPISLEYHDLLDLYIIH